MKRTIFLLFLALVFSTSAFAHDAFTLVSSQKKTIKSDDLAKIETERTAGKIDKTTITFTQNEIRLVVTTGPEDDMLSYRIQGVRNPTLVVPAGATLKILFVNVDEDMRHDIRFGHVMGDFPIAPAVTETVGTAQLAPTSEDDTSQAEEIVLKAGENGMYKYFCSVRGHAKGGMWGNIAVGVKPGADMKVPAKTQHVHSPDEDKMENMPGMKPDEKPGEMGKMDHQHEMEMSSVTNIGDPMTRESSGTAWAPESSPMYARMKMFEDGSSLMFMGNAFLRYTRIGSNRDVSAAGKGSRQRVDAPSMFMAMYSKPINEKSQFGFRAMMSLDPLIERGYGYPLLYQSGEQYRGEPIHDRQHPHDLFTELSVSYSYKFNDKNSVYF
jgi:rusticyanin